MSRHARRAPFEGAARVAAGHGVVQELRATYRALNQAHRVSWRLLGPGDEATAELNAALGALGRAWDSVSERLGDPQARKP